MAELTASDYQQLIEFLERRIEVISDTEWRDRDQEGHLGAIIEASEAIGEWQTAHQEELPKRLEHFLENCSFEKALAWSKTQNERLS
ncbi:MAG: hypothetical protein AAF236_04660 [Verrucomicrobiota bacterium]